MKFEAQFNLGTMCHELQRREDGIYYSKRVEENVEHPRDSAEPKGETNVWPREGTQEARVASRESRLLGGAEKDCRKAAPKEDQGGNLANQTAEGSSLGARRAGASESTFRSVAEQCGKVESEAISYPEEGNEACFEIENLSFWFRHRNECIREFVFFVG